MDKLLFDLIISQSFLIIFFINLFLLFIAIIFWKRVRMIVNYNYDSEQNINPDQVPRLGGICIYVSLIFFYYSSFASENINFLIMSLLISSFPFVAVTAFEDIFHNISPALRLLSIALGTYIMF